MIDAFIDTLEFFPTGLVYVGLAILVLVLAKLAQDVITSYRINEELTEKDNVAFAISMTGYYFGVIAVFLGALYQPLLVLQDARWLDRFTGDFWLSVLEVFVYSVAGIVVLNLARIVVDRLILYRFDTEKEIIEDQNAGTGAVEFGVYVAVGLVIAASTAGGGGDDVSVLDGAVRSLAFLGLGLVVLVLYVLFYQLTTFYDIHAEIERNNVAVGVALGGNLIAVGLVTFKAVFGEFVSWSESVAAFLTFAVIGFVLLFVVRRLVDLLLFPRVKMADELAIDQNLGVAFIVSAVVISAALILFFAV
jgi:uncharacterized membrane protein YjfL (UPF0719 family)